VPRFSAFNSTHFTSKPSYEEQIYGEMVKSLGNGKNYSVEFDSLVAARLYANAMAFGRCKYEIERAGQQFRPSRALENLPLLERELGVVPEPGSTIAQRRAAVVVESRIARGASRTNVVAIMGELFGADFVDYVTNPIDTSGRWPAYPPHAGVYVKPGTPRSVFVLLASVTAIGVPVTVQVQLITGLIGQLAIGTRFIIDSGNFSRQEACAISAVSGSGESVRTITATFTKPHTSGVVLATGRHPTQYTSKRENLFVLSAAAAADATKRRRLHRAARGISTWCVSESSGPFKVGEGRLGITTIGPTVGMPLATFDDTFDETFG
jgi:hypothetical protein